MDKEDLLALKEEGANYVHIFFVIVYENGREDRFLVPMDELMTYLPLRFPGDHLILATIVWTRSTDTNDWSNNEGWLLRKSNRGYTNDVLKETKDVIDGSELTYYGLTKFNFNRNLAAALRVNVPQEFFPKEPPTWVKRWVNLGYEYDAVDQCQFRKRVPYAFTLKPFLVSAFLVLRPIFGLLAMVCYLGMGFRGVDPSVLLHPWRTSVDDLYISRRQYGTFWARHSSWFMEYADGRKKSRLWWLLNPFVPGFVWLSLEVTSRWTDMTYLELVRYVFAILRAVPGILWLLGLLVGSVIVLATGVLLVARSINNYSASKQQQEALPEVQERKQQEQKETERLAFEEKVRVLTCEYVPKRQPSVADIPSQYRTVRLRFLEIKAMVCRPFAGH